MSMGWAFWGPVLAFVVLFFATPLRWVALAAAASGLAAGVFAANALGIPSSEWGVALILVNAAMIAAESAAARLLGGGKLFVVAFFTALGHAAFFYLVFQGSDTRALVWLLLPLALSGAVGAAVGSWLSRR